jgi:outer membrane protein, heavy metal efflux system
MKASISPTRPAHPTPDLVKALWFLCLVAMVVVMTAVQTVAEPIEHLTLDHAIAIAERMHPDIAEAQAMAQAADAQARQAGSLPNPELIGRVEAAPLRGDTLGQADYLAGVSQTVPLGRRLSQARRVETLQRDRRLAAVEARRLEVHRAVHSAFATALYQEQAANNHSALMESAERSVALARARIDAGDATPELLARAEFESARVRREWQRSLTSRELALSTLAATLGEPGLRIVSLSGELEATFAIPTLESIAQDLEQHPFMTESQADVAVSRARVDQAKAGRIPDIRVEALYRRVESNRQNALDFAVSVPLPLFDRNRGRIQAAEAEHVAAEARSRSTALALERRFRESHARLYAALLDVQMLRNELLPRVEAVLRAYEARFAAGDIALLELLTIRREWAEVQMDHLESLRDALHAWGELQMVIAAH